MIMMKRKEKKSWDTWWNDGERRESMKKKRNEKLMSL